MGWSFPVGHGSRRMSSRIKHNEHAPTVRQPHRRRHCQWLSFNPWLLSTLVLLILWPPTAWGMRQDRIAQLRQETVEMFYHGYDNYMDIAFPEDEVRRNKAAQTAITYNAQMCNVLC